jgi:hypothetical protein
MGSDDPPPGPPAESDDQKVIDLGRPSTERPHMRGRLRRRVVVGVVIVATGGAIALAIGDRHGAGNAARHAIERSQASAVNPVAATGRTCSMHQNSALSVGIELANHAGRAIELNTITIELPTGSRFHLLADSWGRCGATNSSARQPSVTLDAGATTWVSASITSQAQCAIPDPIVFVIDYDGGHKLRAQFSALADGRYAGCGEPTGR